MRRHACLLVVMGLFACGGRVEVETHTQVGAPDPAALTPVAATIAYWVESARSEGIAATIVEARADEEADAEAARLITPPATAEEFAARVARFDKTPVAHLEVQARTLARAGAPVWPQIRAALLADRKHRKQDYKVFLGLIGGDVPNRYGHFERAWKRAHGYKVTLSEDWFTDLLALSPERVRRPFHSIYRDCVLTSALLQAAAAIGREDPERTGEVVEVLLQAAYVHEGTFRDEVGRALRSIGDEAVPHLLRRAKPPSEGAPVHEQSVDERMAEYAEYQLDRMDRLLPHRAIASVRDDPRRLAALLSAYGERRLPDAAPHLLEFVDAALPPVQAAARAALLAYVDGDAPKIERKELRLLGGNTTLARARQSFRDTARIAITTRVDGEFPSIEPCEDGDDACLAQRTRAYFEALDARRDARAQAKIDAALASADLDETVAQLDGLLTSGSWLEGQDEAAQATVVPVYERAAEAAAAAGDRAREAGLWRKASALLSARDPARADALRARALLAESTSPSLSPAGQRMLLATAAALAPDDSQIAGALDQARRAPPPVLERARVGYLAGGFAALVLGLLALIPLGARLRR